MPAKERCWRPTAEIKILRNQVHTLRDGRWMIFTSHTFFPLAGDQPLEQADKVVWKKATVGEVQRGQLVVAEDQV